MIILIISLLNLDTRTAFHWLISEPVFLIPVLSLIAGIPFDNGLLFLTIMYLVFSVNALQLGRHTPPEYTAGASASFILYAFFNVDVINAFLLGLFASYLADYIYKARLTANQYIMRAVKRPGLAAAGSLFAGFTAYTGLFWLTAIAGSHLTFLRSSNSAVMPLLFIPVLRKMFSAKLKQNYTTVLSGALIMVLIWIFIIN
ncbi:MAG: hypothetical protein SVK54_05465 [candidate division WOR-3 bacterium]|nr:hypothetical protein [candidate division WOR-3 bacterium]